MRKHYILNHLKKDLPRISRKNPLNEIDMMVFSLFSYTPTGYDMRYYSGKKHLNPINKKIKVFAEEILLKKNKELLEARFGKSYGIEYRRNYKMLKLISTNNRYKDIKISNYRHNYSGYYQFAAYTFNIGDKYIIAYRGTDSSYVGWQETFQMVKNQIPSQALAIRYCLDELSSNNGDFYLTGHSKGGYLATYTAIKLDLKSKLRIYGVYSFDGPGFTKKFVEDNKKDIQLIQYKLYKYSPENSLVGVVLLNNDTVYLKENNFFVKANTNTPVAVQHFPYLWQIEDGKFVIGKQSNLSKSVEKRLMDIMDIVSTDGVANIYEDVFKDFLGGEIYYNKHFGYLDLYSIFMTGVVDVSKEVVKELGREARKNTKIEIFTQ